LPRTDADGEGLTEAMLEQCGSQNQGQPFRTSSLSLRLVAHTLIHNTKTVRETPLINPEIFQLLVQVQYFKSCAGGELRLLGKKQIYTHYKTIKFPKKGNSGFKKSA